MKNYKVFRVSENANSFGLKEFWAMDDKGNCFSACANYLNLPEKGSMVASSGSWELKQNRGQAPVEVVNEVFN